MNTKLEQIRENLRDECLSWMDVALLEQMARDGEIPKDDIEMLEAAGVPEGEA